MLSTGEDRVMMVALDLSRDASPYVRDLSGKPMSVNPFKDRRVREAMSLAVNRAGLVRGVMRSRAIPTGTVVSHAVAGWTEALGAPQPYDLTRAKALLKEAGYEKGFAFTFDTPNNRWVNDEGIVKALASMWAKIGLKVSVNAMPRAQYFPKVLSFDTSAGLVGWGSTTLDAYRPLQSPGTYNAATGDGISNIGRASNAELDAILKRLPSARTKPSAGRFSESGARALEKREVRTTSRSAADQAGHAPLRPDNRCSTASARE